LRGKSLRHTKEVHSPFFFEWFNRIIYPVDCELYNNLLVSIISNLKVPFELGMRRLFYAVTPNETSVPDIKDVPPYIEQVGRLCSY
jgi:hypothetical protein